MRSQIAALMVLIACAGSAHADPAVQIRIQDGHVWLAARDATLSQILAEWARVGQTAITNADRLPAGHLTLEMSGVSEREALDLLLRGASGFVATTRVEPAPVAGPRSQFERIVIVATSRPGVAAAPETRAAETATPAPVRAEAIPIAPGVRRLLGNDGQPIPDDQEEAPARAPQQPPASMPPGFAEPPQAAAAPPAPEANPWSRAPRAPAGVPVPGMVVAPPPRQPGQPPR